MPLFGAMRAGEKSKTGGGDKASADHIHVSVELGRTESMAALSSVKSFLQVASRDAPPTLVCSRGSVAEVYSKLAVRTKTAELERTLEESEPQAQWYHAACNLVSMHKAKQTPPHRIPRIALLTHAGPVTGARHHRRWGSCLSMDYGPPGAYLGPGTHDICGSHFRLLLVFAGHAP